MTGEQLKAQDKEQKLIQAVKGIEAGTGKSIEEVCDCEVGKF
jgi:hypothetical protein